MMISAEWRALFYTLDLTSELLAKNSFNIGWFNCINAPKAQELLLKGRPSLFHESVHE